MLPAHGFIRGPYFLPNALMDLAKLVRPRGVLANQVQTFNAGSVLALLPEPFAFEPQGHQIIVVMMQKAIQQLQRVSRLVLMQGFKCIQPSLLGLGHGCTIQSGLEQLEPLQRGLPLLLA